MGRPPGLGFRFVRGFFVGVHAREDPSEEAWRLHCADVASVRLELRGVLVYTEGGGPNSKQRQALRQALGEVQAPPTAILTASPIARGIVTGLNWFFPSGGVKAFSPHDIEKALVYLAQDAEMPRQDILNALASLAGDLGVKLPALP